MISRRQFLQSGVVGTLAASVPALANGFANGLVSVPGDVTRVLHDTRFPASLALADSVFMARNVSPVTGDLTSLWRDTLMGSWQQQAITAGITGDDVLFCLTQFSRDYRLRVHWQTEVSPAQPDRNIPALVAWLIAPASQSTNIMNEVIS